MEVKQKYEKIKISELCLWSENPRDPIGKDADDVTIVREAIKNNRKKWNLDKLSQEMGQYYDYSELPTVVRQKNGKPVVYDGNRRVAILKYLQNPSRYSGLGDDLFPSRQPEQLKNMTEITCNVCNKDTALENVRRKHISNGSWKQLERDYFNYKHLKKGKSLFIKFEEATKLISTNPKLNQNIMKKDILTEAKLKEIGFSFNRNDKLISVYDQNKANQILTKLAELKNDGTISSRSRYKYNIRQALEATPEFENKIRKFDSLNSKPVNYKPAVKTPRDRTRTEFFGGTLELEKGDTNNIYRDIDTLYVFYEKNKAKLSNSFPSLIRMSLRLLVESASKKNLGIPLAQKSISPCNTKSYIKDNFDLAKKELGDDGKTTLRNHSVDSPSRLIGLLNTGAHDYSASSSIEQTVAMSLIIGEMLKITHSKKTK